MMAAPSSYCTCGHDAVAHRKGACSEFDRSWRNCGCRGWEAAKA